MNDDDLDSQAPRPSPVFGTYLVTHRHSRGLSSKRGSKRRVMQPRNVSLPDGGGRFGSDTHGLAALPSPGVNYHVGFFDPLCRAIGYGGGELRVLHLVEVGEPRQFLPTQPLRDTTVTTQ